MDRAVRLCCSSTPVREASTDDPALQHLLEPDRLAPAEVGQGVEQLGEAPGLLAALLEPLRLRPAEVGPGVEPLEGVLADQLVAIEQGRRDDAAGPLGEVVDRAQVVDRSGPGRVERVEGATRGILLLGEGPHAADGGLEVLAGRARGLLHHEQGLARDVPDAEECLDPLVPRRGGPSRGNLPRRLAPGSRQVVVAVAHQPSPPGGRVVARPG